MAPRAKSSGSRWGSSDKPNWLLIKEHDDFKSAPKRCPRYHRRAESNSTVTGRTMEQIAQQSDHVWNSKDTAGTGRAWYRKDSHDGDSSPPAVGEKFNIHPRQPAKSSANNLPHRVPNPRFIPPQLAMSSPTLRPTAPARVAPRDQTRRLPHPGPQVRLPRPTPHPAKASIGPTACAQSPMPSPPFPPTSSLSTAKSSSSTTAGSPPSLRSRPPSTKASATPSPTTSSISSTTTATTPATLKLRARKELLASLLPNRDDGTLRFSDHIEGSGPAIFAEACKLETEGIISKCDALYRSGRSSDWLKSKCRLEQEFVIAGYSDSTEGPNRFGSFASWASTTTANLTYAGRTGTGFSQKLKRDLYIKLHKLETSTMPFTRRPADARRDVHWVEPKLVAQVRFANWTADNLVRQAAFLGLREDKPPTEVTREMPTAKPSKRATKSASAPARSSKPAARSSSPKSGTKPGAPSSPTASSSAKGGPPRTSTSSIRLTHPDKILDPGSHLTKRQLADYYLAIADRMLPHIVNRPLSLVRCPEGAGKPCFFQKHVNHTLPPGITGVDVPDKKTGVPEPYITITAANAKPETLAGLAQMGVLEVHPWGSANDDLEHPDRLIFDLDPDESLAWPTLCSAAADVRKRLKSAGLEKLPQDHRRQGPPHRRAHQSKA